MSAQELEKGDIISKTNAGVYTVGEAAAILGKSARHIRRLKVRVRKGGTAALAHKNRGTESNRGIPVETKKKALAIIREHYPDFKPGMASEKLEERHGIVMSRETVRTLMTEDGLWTPRTWDATPEYRAWRPRRETFGHMQQFDGSEHAWLEDRGPRCRLLVSMDDARGTITQGEFRDSESTENVFGFWHGYLEENGKPVEIYLDKSSTHKVNHRAAEDNQEVITQFQRVAESLGVTFIFAHSPQAKGRVERLFDTLQDRLVKELRLAGINTVAEANVYLREVFIPWFNERFGVEPGTDGDMHRSLTEHERMNLDATFSIQSTRKIANDFTVQFRNVWYQLEETQPVTVCRKDEVTLEERLDGSVYLRHKDTYLSATPLPERPKRSSEVKRAPVLTQTAQPKPAANHPWRKFRYGKAARR